MQGSIVDLIDKKVVAILRVLIHHPNELYHLQKISQSAKVPLGTTFRIVNKLVKLEIVSVILVGKLKLYRLKKDKKMEVLKQLIQ